MPDRYRQMGEWVRALTALDDPRLQPLVEDIRDALGERCPCCNGLPLVGEVSSGDDRREAVHRVLSAHLPGYGPGMFTEQVITGCSCGWTPDRSGFGGQWAWHVTHTLDAASALSPAAGPRAGASARTPEQQASDDYERRLLHAAAESRELARDVARLRARVAKLEAAGNVLALAAEWVAVAGEPRDWRALNAKVADWRSVADPADADGSDRA